MDALGTDQSPLLQERMFGAGDFPIVARIVPKFAPPMGWLRLHYHAELEFNLILHGNAEYFIRDAKYPCTKNSMLLMHGNEAHVFIPNADTAVSKIYLMFGAGVVDGRLMAKAALERLESVHHLILSDKDAARAEYLLSRIAEECEHKSRYWESMVVDYIDLFLGVLYRAADNCMAGPVCKDPIINRIIEHLNAEFTEKQLLDDVASRFGLSPFTLSRKFKQYVGVGFREYLVHLRVSEARRLLKETDLKMAAVAYRSGFESLTAFNRDFKQVAGISPSGYQKIASSE